MNGNSAKVLGVARSFFCWYKKNVVFAGIYYGKKIPNFVFYVDLF